MAVYNCINAFKFNILGGKFMCEEELLLKEKIRKLKIFSNIFLFLGIVFVVIGIFLLWLVSSFVLFLTFALIGLLLLANSNWCDKYKNNLMKDLTK